MKAVKTEPPVPWPKELKLDITHACPLQCLHCSAEAGPSQALAMAPVEAMRIVDQVASMGCKRLILTGGEPLSHPAIVDMAAFGKRIGLHTALYTTGISHTGVVAIERLTVIERYIDTFLFCLHGSSPKIHDQITGVTGSFRETLTAVELVARRNKDIAIHHVPLLPNVGEFLSLCKKVSKMGVNSVKVLRFVPQGRGAVNAASLALDHSGLDSLAEQLRLARETFPSLKIDVGAPYSVLDPRRQQVCGAGAPTFSIGASLDCYPCDGFKSIRGGVFREPLDGRSLQEFWSSSAILSAVRAARVKMQRQGGDGCLVQQLLSGGSLSNPGDDPLVTCPDQYCQRAFSNHLKCAVA